jgi:hypothetical protein
MQSSPGAEVMEKGCLKQRDKHSRNAGDYSEHKLIKEQ